MSHPRRHRWFRRTALGLALASLNSGSDYAAPEIVQLGYGPGGPPGGPSADARTDDEVIPLEPWTPGTGVGCELRGEC